MTISFVYDVAVGSVAGSPVNDVLGLVHVRLFTHPHRPVVVDRFFRF